MTTYYVDPVNGSDTYDGTSPTFVSGTTGPWATTQKAADTAVAGDEVRLMATGTETLAAAIDIDTNAGAITSPVRFVGADSAGDPLTTGFYTIDANATAASCVVFATDINYTTWTRVRFTNATGDGLDMNSSSVHRLTHCRVDGHGGAGIFGDASNCAIYCHDCEIDSNGSSGVRQSTTSRLHAFLVACSIHDNGGHGVSVGQNLLVENCEIFDNGLDGISINGAGYHFVANSVIYGNTGDGIELSGTEMLSVHNTSIAANGGYGLNVGGGNTVAVNQIGYNHYYSNTSGEWSSGSSTEEGKQTGDPQFASTTDGSEDFTPADGSPLDGTGLNGTDIGAIGTADPAGGGTRAYAI